MPPRPVLNSKARRPPCPRTSPKPSPQRSTSLSSKSYICFVLYFIGGYLLFASFLAAVGSAVNSQEDSTQFTLPVTLLLIFGMYASIGSSSNTDGPLAFWTSLFPLTSPMVMMVRIPFGVPLWQELLSLTLLYASAFGMTWLAGKIYRVGILMYGKKPTVREILKWVRYR